MKKSISLALVLAASLSCNKDKLNKDDYLIFGHFYGECVGEECVELFKIERNKLLEDTKDIYPNAQGVYHGDFSIELSEDLFNSVEDLYHNFPEKLLDENTIIGTPDAGDWGGYYIEYQKDGTKNCWLIDQMKSNIPTYLHPYNDNIRAAIEAINQ